MPRYQIAVNGQSRVVDVDADTPLLWVLRDELQLCGTKYGCGRGLCGACTVHVDGQAQRACQLRSSLNPRVVELGLQTLDQSRQVGLVR